MLDDPDAVEPGSRSEPLDTPTPNRRQLTVYCGSRHGVRPSYTESTRQLGVAMVQHGFDLVYGGGSVGLMGEIADTVRHAGGRVTGVITEHLLHQEVGHDSLDELIVTPDMPTRKAIMFERGDAFVALPGGVGTLEELFEVLCWSTLELHPHPIGLLDTDGFYRPLVDMLDHIDAEGFLRRDRLNIVVSEDPDELAALLASRCAQD